MSWELRGKQQYYTQTTRSKGKVIRKYVGRGPLADLVAYADAEIHFQKQAQRKQLLLFRARLQNAEKLLNLFRNRVRLLVIEAMQAAGYHQHARSQWRKKRMYDEVSEGKIYGWNRDRCFETSDVDDLLMAIPLNNVFEEPVGNPTFPQTEGGDNRGSGADSTVASISEQSHQSIPDVKARVHDADSSHSTIPTQPQSHPVNRSASIQSHKVISTWLNLLADNNPSAYETLLIDLASQREEISYLDDPHAVHMLVDIYLSEWTKRTYYSLEIAKLTGRQNSSTQINICQKAIDSADRKLLQFSKQILEVRHLLKLEKERMNRQNSNSLTQKGFLSEETNEMTGYSRTNSRKTRSKYTR